MSRKKTLVVCIAEGWSHHGKPVEVGAEVKVTDKQAERLVAAKLAEVPKEPEPTAAPASDDEEH